MKSKVKRSPKRVKICKYGNDISIPSYIKSQVLDLCDIDQVNTMRSFARPVGLKWTPSLSDGSSFLSEKDEFIYTVQSGDKVLSTIHVFCDKSKQSYSCNVCWIQEVCTFPEFRRLGYAQKLLRQLFDDNPDTQFMLSVWCQNDAAIALYKSVGFVTDLYKTMFMDGTII